MHVRAQAGQRLRAGSGGGGSSVSDWAALVGGEDVALEDDPDFAASFNEVRAPLCSCPAFLGATLLASSALFLSSAALVCATLAPPRAQLSNRALRVMLSDRLADVPALAAELHAAGEFCSARGDLRAALFAYVLLRMLDHVLVPQTGNLEVRGHSVCVRVFGPFEWSCEGARSRP